jgi:plasmid stability protein
MSRVKTLYLRNVPDGVVRRLELLARREGVSVSTMAVRELADSTRRADNAALLDALPDLGVDAEEIVADIDAGRHER